MHKDCTTEPTHSRAPATRKSPPTATKKAPAHSDKGHCGVGVGLEEVTSERRTHRAENGVIHVVVCVWDGKEFPGMRQNEKRTEFVPKTDSCHRGHGGGVIYTSLPTSWKFSAWHLQKEKNHLPMQQT